MGCRQVVRHMVLVHAFGGSSPSIPASYCFKKSEKEIVGMPKQKFNFGLIWFLILVPIFFLLLMPKSRAVEVPKKSEYSVNEDDLALFATLAYETPSPVGVASFKVGNKTVTYRAHDYKRLSERVKCADENVQNYYSNDKIACLKSDNPDDTPYRYTAKDIVGVDYEAKILKDIKKKGVVDVLANAGQLAATAMLGKEEGPSFYFGDLVNLDDLKSLAGWEVVDFKEESAFSVSDNYGLMSAVTFKKGYDIVIAYRGTDLTDLVDWIGVDGSYALKNNSGQDKSASDYAQYIAKIYNGDGQSKYNIYLTGHSLGGYLSQVAGASLLGSADPKFQNQLNADNTIDNPYNLKRIVYFNGMGLFFSQKSMVNIANNQKMLSDRLRAFNTASDGSLADRVLLVRMLGDLVSSIGVHHGQVKTMSADKRFVEKHNNNLLSINQVASKVLGTEGFQKLSSDKQWLSYIKHDVLSNSIINSIDRILKNFVNLSVKDPPQEVMNKIREGTPYKGLLPYVMATHETDSFFATNYYTDGSAIDSISNLNYSNREDVSVSRVDYGVPFCTFQSDYLPQEDKYKFENKYYQALKVGAGDVITGSIICSSPSGFSDKTISLKDISYTANIKANLIGMKINGGVGESEGKSVIPGDERVVSWDVQIFFPTVGLLNKTVVPSVIKSLNIKSGAIRSKLDQSNNQIFFPYLIITTNQKIEKATYVGKNVKVDIPNKEISKNITDCQLSIIKNVKTKLIFNPTYDGLIACRSDELKNLTIYDSDLIVSPNGRLKDVIVDFNGRVKLSNGQYRYSWSVKFKGAWDNLGPVKITLKGGAIKDYLGRLNPPLESNTAEVSR